MPDRIKLRRGPKSKIDLNVYELGYVTDQNEQRLYFNNGSIVPIPNQQDITNIKTELTKTANVSNKNKQDILYLKDSIDGISATGSVKLVQHSYDIALSESTKKVNIPYERYSSATDTLKVYVNGLAIQNDQYEITDPVEHDGTVTNGYIMLKIERPAGTIVRIEVWKNVPSGEEGAVNGNIIARNTLPLDRIIGLNDITSQWNDIMYEVAGGTETEITLNMPATLNDGYWKKFIASKDNGGAPTTINGKSVYKVSTTNPPRFKKDRPYEVYYNAAKNCFFLKASATGTTSADKVLAGETFSTENDTDLVGTMPNKGAVTASLNCGGSYTIPAGYHNGSGRITANSLASQTSANATAGNIISGKTAWVNGKKITGTATIQSLGAVEHKTGTADKINYYKSVAESGYNNLNRLYFRLEKSLFSKKPIFIMGKFNVGVTTSTKAYLYYFYVDLINNKITYYFYPVSGNDFARSHGYHVVDFDYNNEDMCIFQGHRTETALDSDYISNVSFDYYL